MRFSFIATVLAFAFSVHAVAFDKRSVDSCVVSLTAVSSQLNVSNSYVVAYTSSQGYSGALNIQTQVKNLESKIATAYSTSNCCIGTVVSTTDAQNIIAKLDPITTQIEAILATIVAKKPVFDSVPLVTLLIKNELITLKGYIDKLSACLLAATPADLISTAQGYIDRINAAFAAAIAAYS